MMKLTNICPNCFLKWESDKFPLQCLQCNSNKIISHKELNNLNITLEVVETNSYKIFFCWPWIPR